MPDLKGMHPAALIYSTVLSTQFANKLPTLWARAQSASFSLLDGGREVFFQGIIGYDLKLHSFAAAAAAAACEWNEIAILKKRGGVASSELLDPGILGWGKRALFKQTLCVCFNTQAIIILYIYVAWNGRRPYNFLAREVYTVVVLDTGRVLKRPRSI